MIICGYIPSGCFFLAGTGVFKMRAGKQLLSQFLIVILELPARLNKNALLPGFHFSGGCIFGTNFFGWQEAFP